MRYVYRVIREDTYGNYYKAPLVREVNSRSLAALIKSAREYPRYKIVKIERAPVGEYEDVTAEYLEE
jgi:hypothetical protein